MATTAVNIAKSADVVVGIDTHKYVHVGGEFDTTAGLLSTVSVPTPTDLPSNFRGLSHSVNLWPSVSKGQAPTVAR